MDDDRPVDLDVSWVGAGDLDVVEALARLQLVAGRRGRALCLHGADPRLRDLVALVGLCDTLWICACPPPTGTTAI